MSQNFSSSLSPQGELQASVFKSLLSCLWHFRTAIWYLPPCGHSVCNTWSAFLCIHYLCSTLWLPKDCNEYLLQLPVFCQSFTNHLSRQFLKGLKWQPHVQTNNLNLLKWLLVFFRKWSSLTQGIEEPYMDVRKIEYLRHCLIPCREILISHKTLLKQTALSSQIKNFFVTLNSLRSSWCIILSSSKICNAPFLSL